MTISIFEDEDCCDKLVVIIVGSLDVTASTVEELFGIGVDVAGIGDDVASAIVFKL